MTWWGWETCAMGWMWLCRPSPGMELISLAGRSQKRHSPLGWGHCAAGHLLVGGDNCPPTKSRAWYPSVLGCWQLSLSQCHLPSHGDMCGGCSGWGFPWGQQRRLAAFLGGGCLGTWLCSSMVLCPPPPPPGGHGGLARGQGGCWDRVSEPGEAEPFPLALSLCGSWVGATVPGFSAY